jgi:MarR family 2-MHQ and catechol resistance regulon transcriptional repressor
LGKDGSKGLKRAGRKVPVHVTTAVWIRLTRAYYSITRRLRRHLAHRNLTLPQFFVLAEVGYDGSLRLHEIGKRLAVTMGNITGIVDRMEKAGYVERLKDPKDRRVTWVTPTEKGLKLYEEVSRTFQEEVAYHLEGLTPRELRFLSLILKKLDSIEPKEKAK